MLYEKILQDNICNIKNLDTSTLNINVYFNKYYYDKINEDTNFNDYVLLSEYNLLPNEEVQLTLNEDGNYSLVLFDEINNITTTIDIKIYINYRLSMIKDYLISFCLDNSKYNNKIEPDNYPKNLQGILNEYISLESIINYAFLNNYFNDKFFTLYLENAYNHYRHLFIPDTLNQRQYLNYTGKYNTKYNLCNKIASIFIIGFYLTDIAINTDTKINKIYSINRIKRCINKFGLVYETLRDIYYIEAPIPPEDFPTDVTVITNNVSNITEDSVTLNGVVTSNNNIISEKGFEWKLSTDSTFTKAISSSTSNTFNIELNNLTPNSEYIYKAYVKIDDFIFYGDEITFTTNDIVIILPIVITLIPNPVGLNTATLLGTITPGSEAIISIGFHYKTTSQTWQEAIDVPASGSTNISSQITGLQQTTSYNVRAYVTTASGTVYGEPLNFTTLEEKFKIYFGVADIIPTTKEEVISQEFTTSLTFTTPEITTNINFIAFPETLTLVSVENNSFSGDFWYDDKNDLYIDKTTMDIDGVKYNVYCMTTFMPIAVGAKVILSK